MSKPKQYEAFGAVKVPFTVDGDSINIDSGEVSTVAQEETPTDFNEVWDVKAERLALGDGALDAVDAAVTEMLEAGSRATETRRTIEKLRDALTGLVEWFDGAAPDETPTMMLSNARALLETKEATS